MVKTTVKIEGMMCQMCEKHMTEAFEKRFDVKEVTSSHKDGESVILSAEALPEDAIRETVAETGYTFVSAESAPYKKKGIFGFKK